MKNYGILLAIGGALVLASIACQALGRGVGGSPGADNSTNSDFPMTEDAFNVLDVGDGSILYYSKMSGDDVMKFYRNEYTSRGYAERDLPASVSGGVFSMVFDGDPSGKAIVIQSVDLGDGTRTVTIRFEEE